LQAGVHVHVRRSRPRSSGHTAFKREYTTQLTTCCVFNGVMRRPGYIGRMHVINLLKSPRRERYEELVNSVDNTTLKAILEIVLNIYRGDIHLSTEDVKLFRSYTRVFKRLASVKPSLQAKRTLLKNNIALVNRIIRVFTTHLK